MKRKCIRKSYAWTWGDRPGRWGTLLRALRSGQRRGHLWVMESSRHGDHVMLFPTLPLNRVLSNFCAGQCGALAVDLGCGTRADVLLAERSFRDCREARHLLAVAKRMSVRRARLLTLVCHVHEQAPTRAALLVMRLRGRRHGEVPLHRVLGAFLLAEAGL